jgi:mono/diheme cytochrome c family protein
MCRSSDDKDSRGRAGGWGGAQRPPSFTGGSSAAADSTPASHRHGILIITVLLTGCIQEMSDQPRYDPLEANAAYTEKLLPRVPVEGSIARGQLQLDETFAKGKENGQLVVELPGAVLAGRSMNELLARGRERYTIFCSHCHGQVGGGIGGNPEYVRLVGMVVQRGFPAPPTYHQDRLRRAPIGHLFDVITNGTGRMPPHAYLIPPEDRWAIAAYVRALQLSQFAQLDVLNENDIETLDADTNGKL